MYLLSLFFLNFIIFFSIPLLVIITLRLWNKKILTITLLLFILYFVISSYFILTIDNQMLFFLFYLIWLMFSGGMVFTALILYASQNNKENWKPENKTKVKNNEK